MSKPIISPTITAYDPHEYREQIERVAPFAKRLHIDLMDGDFAPTRSPALEQTWWPDATAADIHLMYRRPADCVETMTALCPQLVVVHFEAEGDLLHIAQELQRCGIKAGLALLPETTLEATEGILQNFDHVLIFSGNLGHHGGEADLGLLDKVRAVRQSHPDIEISWDGGVNATNVSQLVEAGVEVLNTGGFIQNAEDPQAAYRQLTALI